MQKKILHILILLQVLLLAFSTGNYLVNRNNAFSKIYTSDDYQLSAGRIVDNRIVFMEHDGSGQFILFHESLEKGIYQVRINYNTASYGSTINATSSDLSDVDLHCSSLTLDPSVGTTLWNIQLDRDTEDLVIYISYAGDAILNIHEIGIHETSNYYKKNIICTLGLCILLSLAYVFYRADHKKRSTMVGLATIFLFSSYPLMTDYMMVGHDLPFHLLRIEGIYQGLMQGAFPVKIHPLWGYDYGYAVGIFYGDLFLYLPALLRITGFSVQTAFKLFVAFINLGTVLTAYFSFRKIFSSEKAGLVGSALYTLSLYRLSDVYTRASIGEYTALMCLPLILCGFYLIYTDHDIQKNWLSYSALTAFGLTGVIQSHILSVEMAAIFIVLTCLILIKKTVQPPRFLTLLSAALFTVLLNLGFLVPFLSYFDASININSPNWGSQSGYSIQNLGMFPVQLFGLMNRSNGGTWATTAGVNTEATFSLGIVLVVGTCLFLFLALCHPHSHKDKHYKPALLCCLLGILALYMSTCYFPWDAIAAGGDTLHKLVSTLQFPWRFLSIATILLCFPACYVAVNLNRYFSAHAAPALSATLAILLITSCGWYFYDFVYMAEPYRVYDTNELNSMALYSGEYLPTGTDPYQIKPGIIRHDESTTLVDYKKNGTTITAHVISNNGGTIDFPLNYYRDYVCTDLTTGENITTEAGYNNMVRITLPENYNGHLQIRFQEPFIWRLAEVCSLLSFLALACAALHPHIAAILRRISPASAEELQEESISV